MFRVQGSAEVSHHVTMTTSAEHSFTLCSM